MHTTLNKYYKIKTICTLIFVHLFIYSSKANKEVDSLKNIIFSSKTAAHFIENSEKILDAIKYRDPDLTILIADSAIKLIKKNDFNKVGFFNKIAGVSCWHSGNLEESNVYFNKSLIQFIKSNNLTSQAEAYNNIAYNYFELGNYTQALNYLNKSYEIAKKLNNDELLSITTTYFAQINVKIKNYPQAFNAYQQSVKIFKKNKEYKNLAIVYNNIGNLYLEQNFYDSSETWFAKAYQIALDSNFTKIHALSTANIGLNYLEQKKYKEANLYLNESFSIYEKQQSEISMLSVAINLIRLYVETNNLNKAQNIINKTIIYANNNNSYNQLVNYFQSLSAFYYAIKNYEKAYYYSTQQLIYTDSLVNENTLQLHNEMAAKFQNQVLQDKVNLLAKDNLVKNAELEKKQIQKKYFIAVLTAIIFVLMLLSFIVILKNKTQKKLEQQNQIIQKTLEEREVLIREIHHRVKNNLQIVSSLLNLQYGYAANKSAEEILKISESRIQSMALIHEKLYKTDNLKEIDFKDYIQNFIENIKQSYSSNINFFVEVENVKVDIDMLVPCGLILHELIINSIKHSFENKDQEKNISVIAKASNTILAIEVFDNGKGLPSDFSLTKYQSLGIKLVKGLVAQLKGEITFNVNYPGAYFKFLFTFTKAK